MAKIATFRLGWTKSPSADVTKVKVIVNIDGIETVTEVGPEVEEQMVEAKASSAVHFRVESYDEEGNFASSVTHNFTVGDLEAPQPATNLFHELVSVRDDVDA